MALLDQGGFVRAIRERVGLTPTQLGRDLDQANAYNAVTAWEKNKTRLRYPETMAMLSMAGWLTAEAEAAWRGISLEEAERLVAVRAAAAQASEAESRAAREESVPEHRRTA